MKHRTRYLTLDLLPGGEIAPEACLWCQKPVLYEGIGDDRVWLDRDRKMTHMLEYVSKADCLDRFGVYPDNHEQLIRIGPRETHN